MEKCVSYSAVERISEELSTAMSEMRELRDNTNINSPLRDSRSETVESMLSEFNSTLNTCIDSLQNCKSRLDSMKNSMDKYKM